MDMTAALKKHGEWKGKLRTAIEDQQSLDVNTVSRDDVCDLGRWLHGEGEEKFGRYEAFRTCKSNHAQFHRVVGSIAQDINSRQYAQAESRMNSPESEYTQSTNAVVLALFKLREESGNAF